MTKKYYLLVEITVESDVSPLIQLYDAQCYVDFVGLNITSAEVVNIYESIPEGF